MVIDGTEEELSAALKFVAHAASIAAHKKKKGRQSEGEGDGESNRAQLDEREKASVSAFSLPVRFTQLD